VRALALRAALPAKPLRLLDRRLEGVLRPRGDPERGVVARAAAPDDALDRTAHTVLPDTQLSERDAGKSVVEGQSEKQVLGAEITVAEAARLRLRARAKSMSASSSSGSQPAKR
jgi:hypothetical protein